MTIRHLRAALLVLLAVSSSARPGVAQTAQEPPTKGSLPSRTFCVATAGYRFEFPRDHFVHSCFRTEWWYFTGSLEAVDGRRFGFELTFFREGADNSYANPSRWRVDEFYLAHFAISGIASKQFFFSQKVSRAGIEMAGALQDGIGSSGRIWVGPWSAAFQGESWTLEAVDQGHRIRLNLKPLKQPVVHGKDGISQKAEGAGNASHYYSLTRLETSGTVETGGASYAVKGLSWMDHEFSTSQLQAGQAGWDWISLQWEDGTEWMLFQLRRTDGSRDPHSAGTVIERNGAATPLTAKDFEMIPLEFWTSPHSSGRYPISWRLRIPQLNMEAEIQAAMPDQELITKETTGVTYWEGRIDARGQSGNRVVKGSGYLEMTGYAGSLPGGLYTER